MTQVAPKIRSFSELKLLFKSIYCNPVCILWSFWWWTAYAVAYLVDDLDSTLFLAVDPSKTKNGFVKSIVSISCVSAALASGACGKFFVCLSSVIHSVQFLFMFLIGRLHSFYFVVTLISVLLTGTISIPCIDGWFVVCWHPLDCGGCLHLYLGHLRPHHRL